LLLEKLAFAFGKSFLSSAPRCNFGDSNLARHRPNSTADERRSWRPKSQL